MGKYFIIVNLLLMFFIGACKLRNGVTVYVNVDTGVTVANDRHVYIRVFDSSYNLVGRNVDTSNGYAIIPSGGPSVNVLIVEPDTNNNPTNHPQSFREGDYIIHVAINDDGDLSGSKARFESGEKVAIKTFTISSTLDDTFTLNISSSDLKSSVVDTVNLSSSEDLGSGPYNAYCFWFSTEIIPLSGYFSSVQYLSITSGSFSGTSGTVDSLYSTWFGLIPNTQYSLYCFVDYNNDNFITYGVDYEGGTTVSVGSGNETHSLNLKKIIH